MMYPKNHPRDGAGVPSGFLPGQLFRRHTPREDHLTPGVAQRARGYTPGDRIDTTSEPRVRMDITTAVQIASLGDYPLGPVELLTESAPVHLDPLGGPEVGLIGQKVSSMVTTSTRWLDGLKVRARKAREDAALDWPAQERRRENREAIARDAQLDRLLGALVWVLGVGAVLFGLLALSDAIQSLP